MITVVAMMTTVLIPVMFVMAQYSKHSANNIYDKATMPIYINLFDTDEERLKIELNMTFKQ